MNKKSILFFGATSDISKGILYFFAMNHSNIYKDDNTCWELVLIGKDEYELNAISNDVKIRYQLNCIYYVGDILNYEYIADIIQEKQDSLYGIFFSAGVMYEQSILQNNFSNVMNLYKVNIMSAINICEKAASILETKNEGFICGISSVAGDRGRVSNYIYGSSKSAFTTYLEGLNNRFGKTKINILCVKPGFVYTKMTYDLNLPKKLTTTPLQVGKDIFKAIKKNKGTIYTKNIWKYIMLIIIHIPNFIFKKLKL